MIMEKFIKVLISADENEWPHDMLQDMENRGARVTVVSRDGQAVLEKSETWRPDVYILNLLMPGMDAIGVIRTDGTDFCFPANTSANDNGEARRKPCLPFSVVKALPLSACRPASSGPCGCCPVPLR